jgi:hypothetical protein
MGLLRWIARKLGGMGRGLALRSRWLARRLWLVLVADVLLTTRRHWKRLDEDERKRAIELAKESKGRPSKNLTARERREARALLDKFNYVEYGGSVASSVLPFKPFTRLVTKYLVGRDRDKRATKAEAESARKPVEKGRAKKPAQSAAS